MTSLAVADRERRRRRRAERDDRDDQEAEAMASQEEAGHADAPW
jgi:hypothetical protein